MRLGWFSPFPPVRTGIAACSAELVAALGRRGHEVDRYPESAAHDFVWRHRLAPYDLVVYQFGNSSHHDYEWAYALKYPGLVVLHDTRLHHARAAFLLREQRVADYRAEFQWNHPGVAPDVAELAVAGFDSRLYYDWPMVRTLVASSRLVAVHGEGARRDLIESMANTTTLNTQVDLSERTVAIRLGHGRLVTPDEATEARKSVRARYGIAGDAVLFGVFGGLTPEKRLPQILAAFRALRPHAPSARLLLAGAPAPYYDIAAGIAAAGLTDQVTLTGYLDTDEDLTDHLAACDVTLNLRWPTARETSGPWLRALAAGRATIITDLVHLGDVPSLDPRSWTVQGIGDQGSGIGDQGSGIGDRGSGIGDRGSGIGDQGSGIGDRGSGIRDQGPEAAKGHEGVASTRSTRSPIPGPRSPICVAIDILDEDHSLRLAMRRLAADAALRDALGRAARDWWARDHSIEAMADDYERVMREAAARPDPDVELPPHLRDTGHRQLNALLKPLGIESLL